MPGGDGTGPGWAQGRWNCRKGFRGQGRGFGRGPGRGFGFQGAYTPSKEEEIQELSAYADELTNELEQIKKRLSELKK